MNELALFAGAGGGILGGHLLGWRTICAVEWEPYPASVLCVRQNEGLLPPFPIWDDIQTFDGRPWKGIVDVVSGGFPCQDISAAGKGAGLDGERSGMWAHMARVVSEVRPQYVFVENSPMLTTRGGTRVVGDLTEMGYDCKWTVMGAADIGANHQRDRIWIKATAQLTDTDLQSSFAKPEIKHDRPQESDASSQRGMGTSHAAKANMAHSMFNGLQGIGKDGGTERQAGLCGREGSNQEQDLYMAHTQDKGDVWREWFMGATEKEHDHRGIKIDGRGKWWQTEPNVGRVADGVAARVDRLKAIGNGQVPLCAATAWRLLSE